MWYILAAFGSIIEVLEVPAICWLVYQVLVLRAERKLDKEEEELEDREERFRERSRSVV